MWPRRLMKKSARTTPANGLIHSSRLIYPVVEGLGERGREDEVDRNQIAGDADDERDCGS